MILAPFLLIFLGLMLSHVGLIFIEEIFVELGFTFLSIFYICILCFGST